MARKTAQPEVSMRRTFLPVLDNFDELYNALNSGCCGGGGHCQTSNEGISISEDENKLYIDAPMPGVKSDEVSLTLDPKRRVLSLCGEANIERENVKYHVKGSHCHCYEIPLSNEIDMEGAVDAIAKEGILTIALPKSKSHKPKKIEVKVA